MKQKSAVNLQHLMDANGPHLMHFMASPQILLPTRECRINGPHRHEHAVCVLFAVSDQS